MPSTSSTPLSQSTMGGRTVSTMISTRNMSGKEGRDLTDPHDDGIGQPAEVSGHQTQGDAQGQGAGRQGYDGKDDSGPQAIDDASQYVASQTVGAEGVREAGALLRDIQVLVVVFVRGDHGS